MAESQGMNILITGGAGFIGSNLALRLVREGHAVSVLDNLSPQIHGAEPERSSPLYAGIRDKVRFVRGDVCDPAVWPQCLPGQDAVVNLAAETGTGQSMYEIHRYAEVNVGGTARMLDWLANHPHQVKRMVVASSRAIYGEGKYRDEDGGVVYPGARREEDMKAGRFEPLSARTGRPLQLQATDEESKVHPSSVYGITKQNQEQMTMTVCPTIGIEPVALRYQNVYGPGQSLKNPYTGILSIFSTRILNGNPIQIFEDGRESRDFVFIDDVVEATCLALFRAEAAGEVFGIGSGVATDVLTVANTLVACYGASVPVAVTGAFRLGDIRHNYADLGKARRLLAFEPRCDFQAGLRRFSDWVKQQEVAEDTYERSIREMQEKGLFKS
ncbi:MAG TPA: NAD-dependent epimerase/dehydratase family protein [Burkholderiaceae bacterium]